MLDHYYAVIMAGGGGTRLWPLSRQAKPKQLLRLIEERSLFQTSVQRLEGLFPPERIYVVTVAELAEELQLQSPAIPKDNYLLEPMPRGTASVVGLAAIVLQQRDPKAVMAILTSDHYIGNEGSFRKMLAAAHDVAQDNHLVTLGITPSYAATAYGYIQRGERIAAFGGYQTFHVAHFREKPDEEQARRMLQDGNYAWNSGMFVWRVDRVLSEFSIQMPKLFSGLREIQQAWGRSQEQPVFHKIWDGLESETIDYGIMEGAKNVAVIMADDLQWNDVGSWDSLFDVLPSDPQGNIVMGGEHIGLDTRQSLVYVNQEHRLIVTIGIEDLVLVDTGDVLLVCRKDQAQKVRQIVKQLMDSGQSYL